MPDKKSLRVAVVGLGFGASFVPIYKDHPDVRSVAICDSDESRMKKVAEAKENGQWEAAARREQVEVIPLELEQALKQRKGGIAAYRALTASRKKQFIYWLQSAKRPETKRKRIQAIVDKVLSE